MYEAPFLTLVHKMVSLLCTTSLTFQAYQRKAFAQTAERSNVHMFLGMHHRCLAWHTNKSEEPSASPAEGLLGEALPF